MSEIRDSLTVLAIQAIDEGNWTLAATLCNAIAELELADAVRDGARDAWTATTVAVPIIKPPMRDEQPERIVYARSVCMICGDRIVAHGWHQEFVDSISMRPVGIVEFADWRHSPGKLGENHHPLADVMRIEPTEAGQKVRQG